jgi:hypothetical protein
MCDSHRQLWTFLGQYIKDAAAASRLEEQEMKGVCVCMCLRLVPVEAVC